MTIKDDERSVENAYLRTCDAITALALVDDEVMGRVGFHVKAAVEKLEEARGELVTAIRLTR